MTIHPHDTDRILAVLGEAIEKLRQDEESYYSEPEANSAYGRMHDIANDLALLHGAVSAEAQRHDEFVNLQLTVHGGSKPRPIDVRPAPSARARFLSRESVREKLEADDLRGDFREDD